MSYAQRRKINKDEKVLNGIPKGFCDRAFPEKMSNVLQNQQRFDSESLILNRKEFVAIIALWAGSYLVLPISYHVALHEMAGIRRYNEPLYIDR